MRTSINHLFLITILLSCFHQKLTGQDMDNYYSSLEYYCPKINTSFTKTLSSIDLGRFNNSEDISFEKINLMTANKSFNEIEVGLKSNLNSIRPSELNLGYIHYSNNLAPLDFYSPSPSVGKTVGKFFLGFFAGAAIGTAIYAIATSGEETEYVPGVGTTGTGARDTSMDFMGPILILGSGLVSGILFAIKW